MSDKVTNDSSVMIFDTTLRDGEQSPGASMNVDDKVLLARQLDHLGVALGSPPFTVVPKSAVQPFLFQFCFGGDLREVILALQLVNQLANVGVSDPRLAVFS